MGSQRVGHAERLSLHCDERSEAKSPRILGSFYIFLLRGRYWGSLWSHFVTIIKERADYNLYVEQFHPFPPVGLWETLPFLAERELARLIRTENGKLNPCKESMVGPLRSLSYTSFYEEKAAKDSTVSLTGPGASPVVLSQHRLFLQYPLLMAVSCIWD